jgi:putative PEP-CTERM system TPR-repeat lipoprotein
MHVNKLKIGAALVSGALALGAGLAGCHRDESTATLLAEAKQYQQKGDHKAALIQLKNAVAKSPEDGEARIELGSAYLDAGDAVSADKELRKAASLGIPPARTLPLLGKALLAQGQFQKTLDELTPELAKGSAPLLALRGEALLALGKSDEARQAYDAALAAAPNSGEALIGQARLAVLAKDNAGAHRYADEAVAKDGNNPEVWMFRGALLRVDGKSDEALAAYDHALALKPDHRTAHIEKAYLEIGAGKFDAAKADIDAAGKAAPGSLLVAHTQALLDFTQGKYAAAQDNLQKVLRSAPEHMPSILLAGAVELNLGATQQAEQHLRKYLEANPDNLYARKLLAQALLKSAQPGDAAEALAPALKDASQDPQLLALAGESYMRARDFGKASSYFEQASALAPKMAVLHTSLGLARLGQGERDKGVSELELAAQLDPKSPQAGLALIQAELNLKHYDKALAAAQALEKQQPDNPQVQNLKGVVYVSKGDAASARAAFDKALALQPAFFPAVANLARLDMQAKKPDAARQRFQALLEKDKKNVAAMSALAELAELEGKPEEATGWLEKASNENPDAAGPALKLGHQYLRTRQPQKALLLARKFQTANPTNPDLLDLLGQAQLASNDQAGALETYSKLVNVLPKSALAQYRLASVHMLMKNQAAAADDLKHALELQPDYLPAHLAQAELAVRGGHPEQALAVARRLQGQPANAALGTVLEADLLMQQQKPALALPLYEKAFALQPNPRLILTIHRLLTQSGKEKEADQRLAQWLKAHPDDVQAVLYAAERNLAKQQYPAAIAQLQAGLKLAPGNALALNNLAWAYQQAKNPKALETAEAALKADPGNPAIKDTLGAILTERGDTKRALPLLQDAVKQVPNAPELRLHLAQALAKSGDKAGARKELEQVLAKGDKAPGSAAAKDLLKQL